LTKFSFVNNFFIQAVGTSPICE